MHAQVEFLKATQWFDPKWYLGRCPEAAKVPDPLSHYLEHGVRAGVGPNRYIDDLRRSNGKADNPPDAIDDASAALQAEMKLISASGLFDAAYYLENNPDVAAADSDPLHHFCQLGWRQLRNPRRDFDVWWYWSCHLDPAQEVVNPLVHYVLVGRPAGHAGRPPPYLPGPGHALAPDTGVRRICLLAGYDPDGVVDDYVVMLARELSRFADVYYLADCVMRDGQLERLDPYVAGRWAYRHGTYDFGSWAALAVRHVGWNAIEGYDELLLVNDSSYLLGTLEPVFARMRARACDWWGLQATKGMLPTRHVRSNRFERPIPMQHVRSALIDSYLDDHKYDFHVGSYFVAFRAPVIGDAGFRRRLASVCPQGSKQNVVRKYEIGMTQYLIGKQFAFDTFIDDLHPLHPLFTDRHFDLVGAGFPLFKRLLLISNHYNVPGLANWKDRLLAVRRDAPVELMERNLLRVADHEKLHRSFAVAEDATGRVVRPALLGGDGFRKADAALPKFDHWWAFVVDEFTGGLAGNERAVFEAVREDPSIKKIVLTRWRSVRLEGENVVVAPLRSEEGQHHLLRAGQILVGRGRESSLVFPVSPAAHNLIDPAALAEGSGEPVSALLRTRALPRLDIVLCDRGTLPDDLRADHDRLQALCGDRRLVLLASTSIACTEAARRFFTAEAVDTLHGWLRENRVALGVRQCRSGAAGACYEILRGPDTLDLSERRFPQIEVIFRSASALIADNADCFAGFLPTDRPAIAFGSGAGASMGKEAAAADARADGYPDPVCRDLLQVAAALGEAIGPYGRDDALHASRPEWPHNARQVAERIRRQYVRNIAWGTC